MHHNLEAKEQHLATLGTFNQSFLSVEVDLVVLSGELIKLESFSKRIVNQLRELRVLGQELDLVQEAQDLI